MAHPRLPRRRRVPRHGRLRHRLRPLDQQRHQHRHRGERRLPAGRLLRERRVHPGPPDRHPRRRQAAPHLARACAARAAACGSRATRRSSAPGATSPRADRDYFLEEKYPGYGNLVPRDIASRELFKKCFHERRGIFNADERQERERGLPRRHAPADARCSARSSPASSRSTRSSSARTRTRTRCASSPPCTTRWAACGSTSSARANGVARHGLAAQPGDEHPGPLRRAARSTTSTTAPTASAPTRSSRASRAAWSRAPRSPTLPQEHGAGARGTCRRRSSRGPRSASEKKYEADPRDGRRREPVRAPRGARRRRCSSTAPSSATTPTLDKRAREDRGDRRARASASASPTRRTGKMNQGAQFVRHLQQHDRPRARHRAGRAQPRRVARRALQARVHRSATTRTGCARRWRSTRAPRTARPTRCGTCASSTTRCSGSAVHVTDAVDIEPRAAARRASTRRRAPRARAATGAKSPEADAAESAATATENA